MLHPPEWLHMLLVVRDPPRGGGALHLFMRHCITSVRDQVSRACKRNAIYRDRQSPRSLSPEQLKRTIESKVAAFQGHLQQVLPRDPSSFDACTFQFVPEPACETLGAQCLPLALV